MRIAEFPVSEDAFAEPGQSSLAFKRGKGIDFSVVKGPLFRLVISFPDSTSTSKQHRSFSLFHSLLRD